MSTVVSTPEVEGRLEDPRPMRWSREDYYRMGELGLLGEQPVELLDGEILVMSPLNPPHARVYLRIVRALEAALPAGMHLRTQLPLDLGEKHQPQPDIAVVAGSIEDYARAHPTSALLVVEVSEATLLYDRGKKASLYARHGIADYWIANLVEGVLEVRRGPVEEAGSAFGWGYGSVEFMKPGEQVSPLAATGMRLAVAELLG